MKIFGMEFVKSNVIKKFRDEMTLMRKTMSLTDRPASSSARTGRVRVPYYQDDIVTLYQMALYSAVTRTVINALKREVFRNGISLKEKFAVKCRKCGKEFDKSKPKKCDACGSADFIQPDETQLKYIRKFLDRANENEQNLTDVSKQCEDDVNIADEIFLLVLRDYSFSKNMIINSKIREIVRGDPVFMRILANAQERIGYNEQNKELRFCVEHRDSLLENGEKICPRCGKETLQACYSSASAGGSGQLYYSKSEVIHKSFYNPSLTYGFSPIQTIWIKIQTLYDQDEYIMQYYGDKKPPKSALLINTSNVDSFSKAWEEMITRHKNDPHSTHPIAFESPMKEGQAAQFINFMNTLSEMQFTEGRNEIKKDIGAMYGVLPIFQNDVSTSGGLNNEGMQITVTNRAVTAKHEMWNKGIYAKLMEYFEVTDYELLLNPSEEKDESAEIQRDIMKAQYAQIMASIGFDVKLTEKGEFEFEKMEGYTLPGTGSVPGIPKPPLPNAGEQQGTPESTEKSKKPTSEIRDNSEELEDELIRELKEIFETFNFKSTMSAEDIKNRIDNALAKIRGRLVSKSNKSIREIYQKAVEDVEKDLGINIAFGAADENALKIIHNSKIYTDAYDGVSERLSSSLNDVIARAFENPEKFTIRNMVKEMKETVNLSEGSLERIARTETQHITNLARENSYGKVKSDKPMLFKWLNPLDYRTTPICRNITERTKNGVTMEELKKIVREESEKAGMKSRDLTPHVNCRSSFVRIAG